jgi:hypothetical protein
MGWVSGGNDGGCCFLWPLCVLECISVTVVYGACVRDCRGLGLCKVGMVGWSASVQYVGGRGSLVTGWGERDGRLITGGESGREGAERVVGNESNGF